MEELWYRKEFKGGPWKIMIKVLILYRKSTQLLLSYVGYDLKNVSKAQSG
jgi:hypothetical protein